MEMGMRDIKEMQKAKLVRKQNIKRMPVETLWPILKLQENMTIDEVGGVEFGLGEAYIFCKQVDGVWIYKFTPDGISKHVNKLKALETNSNIKRRSRADV